MFNWFKNRARAFSFAFNGLRILILEGSHFRFHFVAMLLVFLFAYLLQINTIEWIVVLLVCALVLLTEAFNTAIEELANAISLEFNPFIKRGKDIAAAAVLISAILALLVGLIIFIPKLCHVFKTFFSGN